MALKKDIQQNIIRIRKESGLSQVKVSKVSGIDVRKLSLIENSKAGENLTLETIERLAKGLNCAPSEIIRSSKEPVSKATKTLDKAIVLLKEVKKEI